ncbi:adenylate/guanylate cyclase domain-containing protein [Spirochaeta isovalerica]|uniref:Class 3 adenylate cyclase n=1 Tax=Spirochaeta isovalerica TaxID=150 RepID=A0A841R6Y1_9SPIO|nr:adenylate/guanylate cyclase domain-containing protein [Spirochaeta isovalerica]MBB6479593.1 class 3 adenylate cyclase [Spirochaeta isovalerica]
MQHLRKHILCFILILLPFFHVFGEDGIIDLRQVDFNSEIVNLEGNWEFYWEKILYPGESFPDVPAYFPVPAEWSCCDDYDSRGYGTYRVILLLPPNDGRVALYVPQSFNQYRIFVNGRLWGENGDVSAEYHVNKNRKGPYVHMLPEAQRIEIIYQISNFDDLNGGILDLPQVGRFDRLRQERDKAVIFESFLFGVLLITGMLYLSFYINKRDDQSSLYFGLFSMVLAFRTILYGEHILLQIFPGMTVETEAALGHMTFYLAVPLFLRFIVMAFPMTYLRKFRIPVNIISGLYIALAIFTRHFFFVRFLVGYQVMTLLVGLGILICLIRNVFRKNRTAFVTLLGFFALLLAAVNDILHSQEIIHTFHMTPIGVTFFIMSQASLLSWNIGKAFRQSEELATELTTANNSFRRFVPEEFLKYLHKEKIADIELGDHVQLEMSVLFCDIRDFTSMSENMTPHENFLFLNSFLERIGPVIRRNHGFVDKYLGDGIMALFPGEADCAVRAALDIQDALKLYNKHRGQSGYEPIHIGVGLNTGSLMMGTIGENERMDSTVISDAVNVCSRIESITKEYGLNIAMSEKTFLSMKERDSLHVRKIGRISLKGKKEPQAVYELYNCDLPEVVEKKDRLKKDFEMAVILYEEKKYWESLRIFSTILEDMPEDDTSRRYRTYIDQALLKAGE